MTMQVGMVASNGIVLASDTRWTISPKVSGWTARHGYNSHKIKIDATDSIAVACARDKVDANRVADALLELASEGEATRADRIRQIGTAVAGDEDLECILVFAKPTQALWYFQYIKRQVVACDQIFNYVFGGDSVNAAVFWVRNYHDYQPIDQLKRLAAHAIVCAGKICPDQVSGLELVYCDESGLHRLTRKENRDLELESRKWDQEVGRTVLGLPPTDEATAT
jgi:hypothetical protein